MKGMSLPFNMIVVILIAIVVLVAIGAYFLTATGERMSRADADRIFAVGCNDYCNRDSSKANWDFVLQMEKANPPDSGFQKFVQACKVHGVSVTEGQMDFPMRCFMNCVPACDVSITGDDSKQYQNCNTCCSNKYGLGGTNDLVKAQQCIQSCQSDPNTC